MSSLLESRKHHQRVRVLSRKAQESNVLEQEPSNRRLPNMATTDNSLEPLSARQRGQRQCREREKKEQVMSSREQCSTVCLSSVFPRTSVVDGVLEQTSTTHRR